MEKKEDLIIGDDKDFEENLKKVFDILLNKRKSNFWEYTCLKNLNDLIEKIFSNYFDLIEGSCCSVDKAGYVTAKLLDSVKENKTFNLQHTYQDEYKHRIENGMDISWMEKFTEKDFQEKCFWCPVTIKNTEDAYNVLLSMINPKYVPKMLEEKKIIMEEYLKKYNNKGKGE